MAGNGPRPKDDRKNPRDVPGRGDWKSTHQVGWQNGEIPDAPDGLLEVSRETWLVWMGAWFAAHWSPEDLPGLRTVIRLYDQVERGEFQRANELRLQMDNYGITPKGQQDRRWRRPVEDVKQAPVKVKSSAYGHLRSVG